jgi:tetratricopeptide (TPR) repeat protein
VSLVHAELEPPTPTTPPAPTGTLPLTGRDLELLEIANSLDHAERGVGSVVLVLGDAGIGKTRLAREAVHQARARGFACAWGSAWAGGDAAPLWPWPSIVEQLGGGESLEVLGRVGDTERFSQFRAVARRLEEAAAERPVLVVLDDVHDADAGALLLTRFVTRAMSAAPVTFVLTARPRAHGEPADAIDDVARDAVVMRPGALPRAALGELLRSIGRPATGARLTELHQLTGGNPLLVHELAIAGPGLDTGVSMRSVLDRRIDQFDAGTRRVLAAAAVLGRHATERTVADLVTARDAMDATGTVERADRDAARDIVEHAVSAGEAGGVLTRHADGRIGFTHQLLADALLGHVEPDRRADWRAAAADTLAASAARNPAADLLAAIAEQRLAACREDVPARGGDDTAGRVTAEARLAAAQDACSAAAAALVGEMAYESAAALLSAAIELGDRAAAAVPVPLVLQLAQSELAAGRLRAARPWFRRAAEVATDPDQLAEAAIGLGGIWVHEHRRPVEHAAFMALLDRALDGLIKAGDRRPDLVARLRVRRAAELIYTGRSAGANLQPELGAARSIGDPAVLAECLSLAHHTMLGPAHAFDRGALADELVAVAASAGGDLHALLGVMWRTIDFVLTGDPRADRALADLAERADALQVAAVSFVAQAIDVMRLIRAGRFSDAEIAAETCFALGTEIGDADAFGYFGAHLLNLRWLQCREEEILPFAREVTSSPDLVEGDVTFPAALAVVAAKAGRDDEAAAALARVLGRPASSAAVSSNWLVSMFCATEAAVQLGDRDALRALYDAVAPYAGLPVMGSLGVVCLGSAERILGVAARGMGQLDDAIAHLDSALAHNRRLGNEPMVAITAGDLGTSLLRRGLPGDVELAERYVADAVAALEAMDLGVRADALRAEVELLRREAPASGEATHTGDTWVFVHGTTRVEIADSIGVQRLVQLLARPHRDVPAADLAGSVADTATQPVLDREALRAYRARVDELRADIDEAEADADIARAEFLRDQLDALLEHLSASAGLGGRSRSFAGGDERARVAVRKSLRRVFDEIGAVAPEFGAQLQASIRTGNACRFDPVSGFAPVWHVSGGGPSA